MKNINYRLGMLVAQIASVQAALETLSVQAEEIKQEIEEEMEGETPDSTLETSAKAVKVITRNRGPNKAKKIVTVEPSSAEARMLDKVANGAKRGFSNRSTN